MRLRVSMAYAVNIPSRDTVEYQDLVMGFLAEEQGYGLDNPDVEWEPDVLDGNVAVWLVGAPPGVANYAELIDYDVWK